MLDGELKNEFENKVAEAAENPAESWSNFEIESELASGGMGTIYKAVQLSVQRNCAIKILNRQDDSERSLKRFLREARLVCGLEHPNIVKVFAVGFNDKKQAYIAMEWLKGNSLDKILADKGKLNIREFRSIFTQIIDGLAYAHGRGIIHRDIKPANIFILDKSETGRLNSKLLDFGIAIDSGDQSKDSKLTQTGVIMGSPAYMSPEQSRGEFVDKRSDLYSICVVMYEALTGEALFKGDSALDIMYKHSNEEADATKLPSAKPFQRLNQCILKGLKKNVAERFQTAEELLLALKQSCDGLSDQEKEQNAKPVSILLAAALILAAIIAALYLAKRPLDKTSASPALMIRKKEPVDANAKYLIDLARTAKTKAYEFRRRKQSKEADMWLKTAISQYEKASKKGVELGTSFSEQDRKHPSKSLDWKANNNFNLASDAEDELGILFCTEGNYSAAEVHLLKAEQIEANNQQHYSRAARELANVYFRQGKIDEAIAHLQSVLKRFSVVPERKANTEAQDYFYFEDGNTRLNIADYLIMQGRLKEAKATLEKANLDVKHIQKRTYPWMKLAILLDLAACESDSAKADNQFREVYELACSERELLSSTDQNMTACRKAALHFEQRDKAAASAMYTTAIELAMDASNTDGVAETFRYAYGFANDIGKPDLLKAFMNGSGLVSNKNSGLQASNYIIRSRSESDGYPIESEVFFAQGVEAYLHEHPGKAIELFEKAKSKASTLGHNFMNQRVSLMSARCYLKMGNKDKALELFQTALSPDQTPFIHERQYLRDGLGEFIKLLNERGMQKQAEIYKQMEAKLPRRSI